MFARFAQAFLRYHRGLAKMPRAWKPWLILLLVLNMFVPWFWIGQPEAQIIFGVALLNYLTFVILTGISGFTRILGLGHIYWIPLIAFLVTRLDTIPNGTFFGIWIRAVIIFDSISVLIDIANVMRYVRGEREEMVEGL